MTSLFDDFDLEIQCEEVYDEDLYEMSIEMQKEVADWFFAHLDEIEEEICRD